MSWNVGSRVKIVKDPSKAGLLGALREVPRHPNTWFKVVLEDEADDTVYNMRQSALRLVDDDGKFVRPPSSAGEPSSSSAASDDSTDPFPKRSRVTISERSRQAPGKSGIIIERNNDAYTVRVDSDVYSIERAHLTKETTPVNLIDSISSAARVVIPRPQAAAAQRKKDDRIGACSSVILSGLAATTAETCVGRRVVMRVGKDLRGPLGIVVGEGFGWVLIRSNTNFNHSVSKMNAVSIPQSDLNSTKTRVLKSNVVKLTMDDKKRASFWPDLDSLKEKEVVVLKTSAKGIIKRIVAEDMQFTVQVNDELITLGKDEFHLVHGPKVLETTLRTQPTRAASSTGRSRRKTAGRARSRSTSHMNSEDYDFSTGNGADVVPTKRSYTRKNAATNGGAGRRPKNSAPLTTTGRKEAAQRLGASASSLEYKHVVDTGVTRQESINKLENTKRIRQDLLVVYFQRDVERNRLSFQHTVRPDLAQSLNRIQKDDLDDDVDECTPSLYHARFCQRCALEMEKDDAFCWNPACGSSPVFDRTSPQSALSLHDVNEMNSFESVAHPSAVLRSPRKPGFILTKPSKDVTYLPFQQAASGSSSPRSPRGAFGGFPGMMTSNAVIQPTRFAAGRKRKREEVVTSSLVTFELMRSGKRNAPMKLMSESEELRMDAVPMLIATKRNAASNDTGLTDESLHETRGFFGRSKTYPSFA